MKTLEFCLTPFKVCIRLIKFKTIYSNDRFITNVDYDGLCEQSQQIAQAEELLPDLLCVITGNANESYLKRSLIHLA